MDGATDRVDLRGLDMLARCRTLRRDDATRAENEARRRVELATAEVRAADGRLDAHRLAWREREAASYAGMTGQTLEGRLFRRERDVLEAMADRAVKLQAACQAARVRLTAAEADAAEARRRATLAQRRLDQGNKIRTRVSDARALLATSLEEQELDDEVSMRFGRRG